MISRKKTNTYYFLFFSIVVLSERYTELAIYLENLLQVGICFLFSLFVFGGEDLKNKENITGNRLQLGSWPEGDQ